MKAGSVLPSTATPQRTPQAERRARSRAALLEAAARGISRRGYANLVLDEVAANAGYTRGALYHQFAGKEDLTLAVVDWVQQTWWAHMADVIGEAKDPLQALLAVARNHAVFCRRDIARVMTALRVEFPDTSSAIGAAVDAARQRVTAECKRLISEARQAGLISSGPPTDLLAYAVTGAVEGLIIELAGRAPHDEVLAERVVIGLLMSAFEPTS